MQIHVILTSLKFPNGFLLTWNKKSIVSVNTKKEIIHHGMDARIRYLRVLLLRWKEPDPQELSWALWSVVRWNGEENQQFQWSQPTFEIMMKPLWHLGSNAKKTIFWFIIDLTNENESDEEKDHGVVNHFDFYIYLSHPRFPDFGHFQCWVTVFFWKITLCFSTYMIKF